MTTTDAMLGAFDKFHASVDEGYTNVRACIAAGDYAQAEQLLAKIAQLHARTSLSMRAYLVRNNLMPGDDQ